MPTRSSKVDSSIGHVGLEAVDGLADGRREALREGRRRRTHGDGHRAPRAARTLQIADVGLRRRLGHERSVTHVADDADDGHERIVHRVHAEVFEALANRVFVRQIPAHEVLIDDGNDLLASRIGIGNDTALDERNTHRGEVVTGDDSIPGVPRGRAWIGVALEIEVAAGVPASQRELVDRTCRLDARQGAHSGKRPFVER